MATTTAQKLKIKPGMTLRTLHAPAAFKDSLGTLPPEVKISATAKTYDQLHWFVRNKAQLEKDLDTIPDLACSHVTCYVYYPKGTSGIQTDLTRDNGWDKLLAQLTRTGLISFDNTWSAFSFRRKTDADRERENSPGERALPDYADPVAKTVQLPGDLQEAMRKSRQAAAAFAALSFSNKKEYVAWIVTAKREETRAGRVRSAIEKLEKGWKNPANR